VGKIFTHLNHMAPPVILNEVKNLQTTKQILRQAQDDKTSTCHSERSEESPIGKADPLTSSGYRCWLTLSLRHPLA